MVKQTQQSGFVAIFTVLFFIVLISVLTFGFLRVMLQEQRQVVDNDLSSSARHAAEAGIEDGKRVLLYCNQVLLANPGDAACLNSLSQQDCPGVFSTGIATQLGVNYDSSTGSVSVPNGSSNQSYTCLSVNRETNDYVGEVEAFQGDIVPLKGTAAFDTIEFSWHLTTPDADGPPKAYGNNRQLPTVPEWANGGDNYPAYMRLQFMSHPVANFDVATLDTSSRTVFLNPTEGSANPAIANVNFLAVDDRTPPNRIKDLPVRVACMRVGATTLQYACRARLQLGTSVTPTTAAYLRVTALYGASNFKVCLNSCATPVPFDGVQPVIDSTGRSNDVFRRIQARVRIENETLYPQFALETGGDICKDFLVTSLPAYFVDACAGP